MMYEQTSSTVAESGVCVRIAAYCRVSTDKTDQINSLENQKKYFYEYIKGNTQWRLAEIYVDEGVTGTSTRKRREFNRMIEDALQNKFDIIITKEISRFARNTLDSIFYTRRLKAAGVGVIFMNDGINTLDADSELRLTIMSSIAQEESRKTSDRVKWGQKRRMEQGVVFGRSMLGYDVRNGELFINADGAETVRSIFRKLVCEGKGTHVIARELREAGTATASGLKEWSSTAILRILRNEKYCGDLVQKKTHTPSYLDHMRVRNGDTLSYVVIKDHHEAIISREMFEAASAELAKRAKAASASRRYSAKSGFSGKIRCGVCGKGFVPLTKKRSDGTVYRAWRCAENAKNGGVHTDAAGNIVGCGNTSVNEEALQAVLMQIIGATGVCAEDRLKKCLREAIKVEPDAKNDAKHIADKLEAVKIKRRRLTELYAEGEISIDEFRELKLKYEKQAAALRESLSVALESSADDVEAKLFSEVHELLSGRLWADDFYRSVLDRITVHRSCIEILLCGTKTSITALY